MMKRFMFLVAVLLAWVQSVQAGGFQIGEMSARSTGMGSAFTAVADDASAAWFNPAGVAFSDGIHVMLGGAAIFAPGTDYTPNAATVSLPGFPAQAPAKSKNKTFFAPHAYYTCWDPAAGLGASISVNSPFGLETDWAPGSSLASSNTFTRLSMLAINPSVIFKITDHISISGGFSYVYLNKINLDNLAQQLEGKNKDGWGGTASLMAHYKYFRLGVNYRSRVAIDINAGTVIGGPVLGPLAGSRTSANTKITLPDSVNVGLAWQPNDAWLLSLDVDWTNWKTFNEVRINYVPSLLSTVLTGGTGTNVIPENWKDTVTVRAGVEWHFVENMRARFGYVYDPSPIDDVNFSPAIPGNDRQLFSLGYSYDFNKATTLDLAYTYVYFRQRDQIASVGVNAVRNGSYKTDIHIAVASLQYAF